MSSFVTDDLETSVVLMRCLNALITIVHDRRPRPAAAARSRALATVPLLVTAVPLGISLVRLHEPQRLGGPWSRDLLARPLAPFETEGTRSVLLQGFAMLAMLLAAGSRADGCLFIAMSVVLVLSSASGRSLGHRLVLVTCAICLVVPFLFFINAGQSAAVATGLGPAPPPVPGAPRVTWVGLAVANLQALPTLWFGSLGYGNMGALGWLDTPFPALVGFLPRRCGSSWSSPRWRYMSRVKALAVALLGLALIVYPLLLLGRSGMTVGSGFQARLRAPAASSCWPGSA